MAATTLPLWCAQKRKNEVYMWGNGVYQARPDALLQFKNFSPKKITNLPDNLVRLQFGEYYEAGIDDQNNLWIWLAQTLDSNIDAASSTDNQRQQVQKLCSEVKEVKFTTGYIWVLTTKGRVYQYPIVKDIVKGEIKGTKLGKMR